MMAAGYIFFRTGIFDMQFADKMNNFVFKTALPVLLFKEMSESDFYSGWDGKFVLFCFVVSLVCILAMCAVSFLLKDRSVRAEFIQSSYRSSAALIGCAFVENIYGSAGAVTLMIIGAVPLYNISAVAVLTMMKGDGGRVNGKLILKTIKGVLSNPLIIGIIAGLLWSLLGLRMPTLLHTTINSFAAIATPLGLMALGASFDYKSAFGKIKLSFVCVGFKLVVFVAVFLPVAIQLGFREDKLVAILVMLGAASAVSCFTMAKSMGHDGTLSTSVVMLTTLLSSFTLTGWLYILKSLMLI